MSSLAKTTSLSLTSSIETKSVPRIKPAYYIPLYTKLNIAGEQNIITSQTMEEIPIDKWTMPVQPQGYLSAKQHDIF